MSVKLLKQLYEKGQNERIIETISSMSPAERTPEVEVIGAWAHFRRGEYAKSSEIATRLSDKGDKQALELLAQLVAYVGKDDYFLAELRRQIPGNPSICNALAIRARDADSDIPIGVIVDAALRLINDDSVGGTNLLNNAARMLLAKGDGGKDVVTAIGFWQIAIIRYGDKNHHHRAAVFFWLSKAYEALGAKNIAIKMAEESIALWQKQFELDPENKQFKERLEGAKQRLKDLTG